MGALERVTVAGAGLMGHGIAQVFAAHGHPVRLFDTNDTILMQAPERIRANLAQLAAHGAGDEVAIDAIVARVSLVQNLAEACAGTNVVIEAVSEKMDLKQRIFAELDHLCHPDVILCSNTSVMSITEIASKSQGRERILGTHWWNPPYLVPLVEIVRTVDTAQRCIDAVYDLRCASTRMPPGSSVIAYSMPYGARPLPSSMTASVTPRLSTKSYAVALACVCPSWVPSRMPI